MVKSSSWSHGVVYFAYQNSQVGLQCLPCSYHIYGFKMAPVFYNVLVSSQTGTNNESPS